MEERNRFGRPRDPWHWDELDDVARDLDPADIDVGEPVRQLVALRDPAGGGFFDRVRNSIGRRVFANQAADLAIPCVLQTLLEYVSMVFSLFEQGGADDRRPRGRRPL